jgi:Fe(3+) dicitrate transport protein
VGQIEEGDPFPYAPRLIMSVSIGLEKGPWSHRLVTQYTGSQFDQSVQSGRFEVPAFTVFDFFSNYKMSSNEEITFRADNILDTTYVVSFRPFGARPGKPQSFQLGYRYTF